MKTIRRLLVLCLVTALAVSPAFAETQPGQEAKLLDYLSRELEANADHLIRTGEDVDDIYTELDWDSLADTFPARFDLRERGTVTSVKDQTPWSTCWSFADIAASETSILNALGMTTDMYRVAFGEDLDLSERHLAWFTATALPELEQYPEGEYPALRTNVQVYPFSQLNDSILPGYADTYKEFKSITFFRTLDRKRRNSSY